MTIIQLNEDKNKVQEFLNLAKKLHMNFTVIEDTNTLTKKQTKWSEFANKMDGIFTPDIIEHINNNQQEVRDNFTTNI